jgi:hypothetical protein
MHDQVHTLGVKLAQQKEWVSKWAASAPRTDHRRGAPRMDLGAHLTMLVIAGAKGRGACHTLGRQVAYGNSANGN